MRRYQLRGAVATPVLQALLLGLIPLLSTSTIKAQVPFDSVPGWISSDRGNYSTGIAWSDLNKDGWLDLVVANGNDMARQHLAVYYNTGTGSLPQDPDWQSCDVDYHGQLSIGDVNNDTYPDVAVSVYLGERRFAQQGHVKVYFNREGTLECIPSWVSRDAMFTFSCAFGDANGDGFLDLAVACGESYQQLKERNRIYFNNRGVLDSIPGWKSAISGYSYDVSWGDFDNDGDLDIVFANDRLPYLLYLNYGDSIGTSPAWRSADTSGSANSLIVGDVSNDGYLDLAVSDNSQLGGWGRFKIYLNHDGNLDTLPYWKSDFSGLGSGINLADLDNDDDRDLITGAWWNPCRVYVNQTGTFTQTPQWTSATESVIETITLGDYDNDGIDTTIVQFAGDGVRKLFYLPRVPIQGPITVHRNGVPDTLSEYCADLENGWISFGEPPPPGVTVSARVVCSHDLDLAVSNWDGVGNYVFSNRSTPTAVGVDDHVALRYELMQNYPNPFNPTTTIRYALPAAGRVSLEIYNVLGELVRSFEEGRRGAGRYEISLDAGSLPSGIYFYRLRAGRFADVRKMVLLK